MAKQKDPVQSIDEFIESKPKPLSEEDYRQLCVLIFKKSGVEGNAEAYADKMVKLYRKLRIEYKSRSKNL